MVSASPTISRKCSAETQGALRRARELVTDMPVSDRTAFALLQLEMGYDLEEVRWMMGLDWNQAALIRQRHQRPLVARERGGRQRTVKP